MIDPARWITLTKAPDGSELKLPRFFVVSIPVPPSLNNVYRNVAPGFTKSGKRKPPRAMKPQATLWKHGAVRLICAAVRPSERIGGRVIIRIEVPTGTLGDIDNRIKLAVDSLVMADRIDDDRKMHECSIKRVDGLPKGYARITVVEYQPVAVISEGAT